MSHARGTTDGPTPRSATLPAAFMARLLEHINPHRPPPEPALLDAQRACGRWCALRRLRTRVNSEQFAGMVGIPVEQLAWLEAGLAKADDIPGEARQRLTQFLRAQDDSAWVAQVIALACGQTEALNATVMDRVFAELIALDSPTNLDRELAFQLVDPSSLEQPEEMLVLVDLSDTEHASVIFAVLRSLFEGESYLYAIWEQVHQQLRSIGIAELGELLDEMCASDLIEHTETRLEPSLDEEPLPFYKISAVGRQVFNAERTRRAIQNPEAQAQQKTDPSKEALGST